MFFLFTSPIPPWYRTSRPFDPWRSKKIEAKRASVRDRVQEFMTKAVQGIRIGDAELMAIEGEDQWMDTQRLILHEVREKLLGRGVTARGSVSWLNGQPYFFPSDIELLR
jgi:hypothetical protein